MLTLDVLEAGPRLAELVASVAGRGERVTLTVQGAPSGVLLHPRELASLVESIELLSDHEAVRRIAAGESAFQAGDVLAGTDLSALDPTHRFVRPPEAWDVAVSGPARRALERGPVHLREMVLRFVFERLSADPQRHGVELRGGLSRRHVARIETERVVYRLDSVKRSVRVIEVLHGAGLVGQSTDSGRRW